MDQRFPILAIRIALIVLAIGASAADLQASPESEVPDAAVEAYAAGNFAGAAELLEEAYINRPSPQILYAWAQAARMAGNCRLAIDLYGRFVEQDPTESDLLAARSGLRACHKERARQDEEARSRSGSNSKTGPEGQAEATSRGGNGGWVAFSLSVGGALGLVGSGVLYFNARTLAAEAPLAPDIVLHQQRVATAETRRNWSVGIAGVGGAMLVAGALFYFLGDDDPDSQQSLSAQLGHEGGALRYSLSF